MKWNLQFLLIFLEKIFGITADEFYLLKENHQEEYQQQLMGMHVDIHIWNKINGRYLQNQVNYFDWLDLPNLDQ